MKVLLHTAGPKDREALRDYLLKDEEYWTALTDRLRRKDRSLRLANSQEIQILSRDGDVGGCIYNDSRGYTFPAFKAPLAPGLAADLGQAVRRLPKVQTLLGDTRIVELCAAARKRPPDFRVDYTLMARRSGPGTLPAGSLPAGLEIFRADPSSARAIYPLQKSYELEEVLLDPKRFNPLVCMSHLKESLKRETIYAGRLGGELAAKAGTNARGFGWAQIGGVYTIPRLRGRGLGKALMRTLLEDLEKRELGASLFVKPANGPACALYRHLGFKEIAPFTIIYYLR
jgi:ribosomal protein S18 acetylase RimI-like enzyme